jgi:hypothetical protein
VESLQVEEDRKMFSENVFKFPICDIPTRLLSQLTIKRPIAVGRNLTLLAACLEIT